ncbi:hypothetical protein [Paraconexibacter sp.]|uniref:hypothetical protein n=1 Tax=Paraconexibacter sp. TaxID=2949640 RepID=UPI003564AA4D
MSGPAEAIVGEGRQRPADRTGDRAPTAGERWIREELQTLRDAGFTPAALARFLVRSQQRANATRADRPDLARREGAVLTAGAVAYVPVVVAGAVGVRPAACWWLLTGLMLDWHLGMLESEDGAPRNLGTADVLTLGRAWVVPLVARRPTPALVIGGWGSDVLDGLAARHGAGPTRAGRDLEGLVDAAFGTAVLVGARRTGGLGTGVVAAEVLRLGVGVGYAVFAYFGAAAPPDRAMLRAGRVTTVLRALGAVLATSGRRRPAEVLLTGAAAASVALFVRAGRVRR